MQSGVLRAVTAHPHPHPIGESRLPASWPETRAPATGLEDRVMDAALRCIGRWGLAKTTLDDIAREAGCSRATVYRAFPGGKDVLLRAVLEREALALLEAVRVALAGSDHLEEAVTGALVAVARAVEGNAALQFVLAYEPEIILPQLAFAGMDRALAVVGALVGPHLARWVGEDDAGRAAQWLCRLTVSYIACPAPEVDMQDEQSVRRMVRRFVAPALAGAPSATGSGSAGRPEPAPSAN